MIFRSTRPGFPADKDHAGISLVTTLAAPMTELLPMWPPRKDHHVAADPNIVANAHRNAILIALIAQIGVEGMSGGVDGYIGRQHAVVLQGDSPIIQNGAVVVDEAIAAHKNIAAVVAVDGGFRKVP